ncbi:hypothetical protein V2W30_22605 [Streptomyces sp. Q6]|uniref:Uncharacterized protein n=1 Tax=Streptomyces citrinus TaxID=3118173 RepID=A0ACD5AF07_9ACTN
MSQPYTPAPPAWTPQPPPRFNWARWALWTALAAVLAFALAGGLGYLLRDDSSTSADPAACKAAMRADFKRAAAAGSNATPSDRPAECAGVDDATVQRYATEIVTEQLGDIEP